MVRGRPRADEVARMLRFAPLLVLALIGGFLLGGCGGGGAGTALTTGTRTVPTLPARTDTEAAAPIVTQIETSVLTTIDVTTIELTTEATTTEEITTVVQEPVTTTAILTVTTAPPRVETAPAPVTTAQTETAEPVSSTSDNSWAWLALALVFLAAVVVFLIVWNRHRGAASSWAHGMSDLRRRSLVTLDAVIADGSLVTGQVEALAAEAASLEARAPGNAERADSARVRASLDGLAETLQTDRTLRLNSPPPSAEQLEYSTARIRHQAQELQGVLRPPGAGGAYAR